MPSDKKRINLTVPVEYYEMIERYMEENGLYHHATACLNLIVKGLGAYENQIALYEKLFHYEK